MFFLCCSNIPRQLIHFSHCPTQGEDSYSSNSSGGSDSETSDHNKSSSSGTSSPAASASPTAELSPTAGGGCTTAGYKFDHLDTFAIGDVLICHTDRTSKACVVWVVRRSGTLEALVFDCLTEDNARQLYRKFHEVSKRSKLERHRRRKSDGGSIITRAGLSTSELFSRPPPPLPLSTTTMSTSSSSSSDVLRARGGGSGGSGGNTSSIIVSDGGVSINYLDGDKAGGVMTMTGMTTNNNSSNSSNKWNLVQHTDRNGVTHIEVEATNGSGGSGSSNNITHLVKRIGVSETGNGSTDPLPLRSLGNFPPASKIPPVAAASSSSSTSGIGSRWSAKTEKSKFAKELETILSTELRRRGAGGNGEETVVHSSTITAGSVTTTAEIESPGMGKSVMIGNAAVGGGGGGGIGPRSPPYGRMQRPPHGESLSLRQRTPAMLLRKLDEFEEKAHRIWAKAEAEEENRKVWSSSSNRMAAATTAGLSGSSSLIGVSSPLPRGPQLDPPLMKKPLLVAATPPTGAKERKEDQTSSTQQQPATPHLSKKSEESSNNNSSSNSNRILIPTKTGREPPKKLYPKESPPLFGGGGGGGRFVPVVGVSGSQMGLLTSAGLSQPHSLPLYPVQVGWSRYPTGTGGEVVAPMSQLDVWKYAAAVQESWRPAVPNAAGGGSTIGLPTVVGGGGPSERSRSRDRSRGGGNLDPEHRRRAQSKSPARRPISSRMEDVAGIGRMFRDFGDAVRSRMGGSRGGVAGQQQAPRGVCDVRSSVLSDQATMAATDGSVAAGLKSNLKKQRNHHGSGSGGGGGATADQLDGSAMSIVTPSATGNGLSAAGDKNGGVDNKKVHFNKFATVQMMA
jgi:hypothetical protein